MKKQIDELEQEINRIGKAISGEIQYVRYYLKLHNKFLDLGKQDCSSKYDITIRRHKRRLAKLQYSLFMKQADLQKLTRAAAAARMAVIAR